MSSNKTKSKWEQFHGFLQEQVHTKEFGEATSKPSNETHGSTTACDRQLCISIKNMGMIKFSICKFSNKRH